MTCLYFIPTATKADGFALYFLGECNNVSAEDIIPEYILYTNAVVCMYLTFFPPHFPLCSCLCFSIEFMFVHSNGGQGWPSMPHPLRPHRIWDNHCRSCCQDSQNSASRGHHGGKATSIDLSIIGNISLQSCIRCILVINDNGGC